MEEIYQASSAAEVPQTFAFKGKGSELFGIQLPNWVLTVVTLGIYYPWAKAEKLKYLYQKTEFAGSRFKFHGTGKEMFRGFIKAVFLIGLIIGVTIALFVKLPEESKFMGTLFLYLSIGLVIPMAIFGQMRYRTSRSSWRGIHFKYTGDLKTMYTIFLKGILLTLVTLGLYLPWFMVDIRKEIMGNIRFGNIRFSFDGEGGELFGIHFKGRMLTMLTLGIYFFWYQSELHQFYVNNILLEQDGKYSRLEANVTGKGYLKLLVGNVLIIVFTLGLGTPLATIRSMKYVINNSELFCNLDLENLEQAEPDTIGAAMEDVSDILNLDLV
ncbi:DUF898 domain-containing protein [Adhaeribacter sp. BT258]|uniref:DUF898 domain-containing protein n=1 Tax=Adhaeribacter terrigena TaxID=2793070 RepID=A0ABS1C5F4_9BACT|nr:YjgN family protein [Adhaeribacter terrigena]MBK0404622.1 DUF898 domain-containing protein [Adhaeribacter terrigena]